VGIDTSPLRHFRKANRSGIGIAWRAIGTRKRMGIVRSAFRQFAQET
jgi:hypothetical protein